VNGAILHSVGASPSWMLEGLAGREETHEVGLGDTRLLGPGSFLDALFFSIQTLATVGYGTMSAATLYRNIVSAIEIVCGLIFTAIITGLIFVRFSKPRPNILFADHASQCPLMISLCAVEIMDTIYLLIERIFASKS
jgi:Ion channel